jgi:hypothetical protein
MLMFGGGVATGHLFAPCHTRGLTQRPRNHFLLGGPVTLVLYIRSLDSQLDRLAQARGNEVSFRVIP